jgi:hypothetical protein
MIVVEDSTLNRQVVGSIIQRGCGQVFWKSQRANFCRVGNLWGLFRISNAVSSDLSFLRDFVPPNLALGSKRAIGTVSAEAVECEEPEIE